MQTWYLYIIRCCDDTLYTGVSTKVAQRFEEHKKMSNKGAKYLRGRGPLKLVFKKKIGTRRLSQKLEYKIKKLSKYQKEMIIHKNPKTEELISELLCL